MPTVSSFDVALPRRARLARTGKAKRNQRINYKQFA